MGEIQVVGAGGIGCAIGYALRSTGCSVTIVETNIQKLESGRRDGLRVDRRPSLDANFVAFDDWQPAHETVVLLCTKCYDNAAVLARLPRTSELLPIQNGFDPALERGQHDLEGIASFVSECDPERPWTRITRPGKLHLGPRVQSNIGNPLLDSLTSALQSAGLFRVVQVRAIEPYKYTKLMYNAAISPIAAAAGIDNGKLLSVPAARRLFFALLQENYRILRDAGIELGKVGPFHPATVAAILQRRWVSRLLARAFEPSLRGTYCSMAPDLPKGITEIDNYNQRLVDLAADRPCPLNRTAVAIIKRMEKERLPPHVGVLDEFAAALSDCKAPR
jgi:2-dehydropantoate 2-reductase